MTFKHLGIGSGPRILVPLEIQVQTIAHLRDRGSNHEEGFLAWSGIHRDSRIIVKSAFIPAGEVLRHHLGIGFSDDAIEVIANKILAKGEKLIAQVHSHPFEAFHSETDNRFPLIHRKGFLSIVVPFFGKYGFDRFDYFRIYEYLQDNQWDWIGPETARKRFMLEGRGRGTKWKSLKNSSLARKGS
jgi:hypothetical protein